MIQIIPLPETFRKNIVVDIESFKNISTNFSHRSRYFLAILHLFQSKKNK